ncbi:Uncharacterized protein Fot_16366 [Forsythia ovata]|uniref:Uncharacterized protein n=1 Tax=Forsythia ovata TaxID=205694 RepID=A0ABD1WC31_9LAMI
MAYVSSDLNPHSIKQLPNYPSQNTGDAYGAEGVLFHVENTDLDELALSWIGTAVFSPSIDLQRQPSGSSFGETNPSNGESGGLREKSSGGERGCGLRRAGRSRRMGYTNCSWLWLFSCPPQTV